MTGEKPRSVPIMDAFEPAEATNYEYNSGRPASINTGAIREKTLDFLQQQINDILDLIDTKFANGELNRDPEVARLHRLYTQLGEAQSSFENRTAVKAIPAPNMKQVVRPEEYVAQQSAPINGYAE